MNLGRCLHCHDAVNVYQNVKLDGSARLQWDGDGLPSGIRPITEKFTPHSKVVRCVVCHHIRRDWMVVDGELVRGE